MISADGRTWYTLSEFRRRLAEAGRAEAERPWMATFLEHIRQGRTVRIASDFAGVSHVVAYSHRRRNRDFRRAWDEAAAEALLGRSLPLAS